MFASKLTNTFKRLRGLVAARRFVRREDGAVAVEFAMIMLPFLTLMFVMVETAVVFFAGQTLETAAADSARLIKTGQMQGLTTTPVQYKEAVCARIFAMFDCAASMYVDVRKYDQFSSIDNSITNDAGGKPATTFDPGGPGDIVVVRLIYDWPIAIPFVQKYLTDSSATTRRVVATVAFRNEPFTPATPPTGSN